MSSTTTNKSLTVPSHGSFSNDWDVPVNANWQALDSALGGTTTISVTGLPESTIALTATQYTPIGIEFTGTIGAQLIYTVPAGVGGVWSIYNNTSGAFNLYIGVASQNTIIVLQGFRQLFISDGTTIFFADDKNFPEINGQIQPDQVPQNAVTQFQTIFSIATTQLTGAVPTQLTGTWQNSNLPNAAAGPGVTIAADPGTTPSGAVGAIFYYY